MSAGRGFRWLRRIWAGGGPDANPNLWVLVLGVGIACVAAFVVVSFFRVADDGRQKQLVLAEIELLTRNLRLVEQQALEPDGEQRLSEIQRALANEIAKLTAAGAGDAALNVHEATRSYLDNAGEHVRLRRAGRAAGAEQWDRERSQPSHEVVLKAIYHASGFYSAQASRAVSRATRGSITAIVSQAFLIALLVLLSERRRRAIEVRIAEEKVRKEEQVRSMMRNQEELRYQAHHDALTGLANRVLFHDRLHQSLAGSRRRDSQVAVLYFDLDDFKQVNDALGHEVGDELLVQVSERLRASVRSADLPARLGGDEFLVLAQGIDARSAAELAARILTCVEQPFQLGANEVAVSASIGIAFAEPETITPEDLVRNADLAMYAAKRAGKGGYQIFDSSHCRRLAQAAGSSAP